MVEYLHRGVKIYGFYQDKCFCDAFSKERVPVIMPMDASDHYDHVTEAWKEFMGDHMHFGYFESEDMDLERAVEVMTGKMLELCDISSDSRILDVGCGIGGPAFYIHEKYGCTIDGISTSERGVQMANDASRERGYHNVRFKAADAVANGFQDSTFDVVWIMESSHLMPYKKKMLKECFRVLKQDGTLVLCDLIMPTVRSVFYGTWYLVRHYKDYIGNRKVWGPAQIVPLGKYCDYLLEVGFREVTVFDVSKEAMPTVRCWRQNALRFIDSDINEFSRDDVRDFVRACEALEGIFKERICGYGIVQAVK